MVVSQTMMRGAALWVFLVVPSITVFGVFFDSPSNGAELVPTLSTLAYQIPWIVFELVVIGFWPFFVKTSKTMSQRKNSEIAGIILAALLGKFAGITRHWEEYPWWIVLVMTYLVIFAALINDDVARHLVIPTPSPWSNALWALTYALFTALLLTNTARASTDLVIGHASVFGTVFILAGLVAGFGTWNGLNIHFASWLMPIPLIYLSSLNKWFCFVVQAPLAAMHIHGLAQYGVVPPFSESGDKSASASSLSS